MSSSRRTRTTFQRFIDSEAFGGVVLMASAALGLAMTNSPLAPDYEAMLHAPIGGLDLLHWINDGLMTFFFLLVGLEIKREMVEGHLDTWQHRALPLIAAFGGMIVPALIFMAINFPHPENWRGWAVPTATDIAFALGVLALLGSRVPNSLKVFLTSLAIIDDLGAILIIATFYGADLSLVALAVAAVFAATLYWLNRRGETRPLPYILLGFMLWVAMLFSGIHATLAGVILAMMIPIDHTSEDKPSLLHSMERGLSKWVAYLVLPIFGFANAGVSIASTGHMSLLSPLGLGIIGGLFLGKQIGVLAAVFLARQAKVGALPAGASWRHIYGVAALCGIGFTMSLFIGLLAFTDPQKEAVLKLAVLVGSLLSALAGALILLSTDAAKSKTAS
ncbi:MAG TPA: Na+/H+ antiporter NhaA [Methyloceanibacter sp.]|nr:Na+/H+ antiporter NhaA [Methyloceanibacter sp.]